MLIRIIHSSESRQLFRVKKTPNRSIHNGLMDRTSYSNSPSPLQCRWEWEEMFRYSPIGQVNDSDGADPWRGRPAELRGDVAPPAAARLRVLHQHHAVRHPLRHHVRLLHQVTRARHCLQRSQYPPQDHDPTAAARPGQARRQDRETEAGGGRQDGQGESPAAKQSKISVHSSDVNIEELAWLLTILIPVRWTRWWSPWWSSSASPGSPSTSSTWLRTCMRTRLAAFVSKRSVREIWVNEENHEEKVH